MMTETKELSAMIEHLDASWTRIIEIATKLETPAGMQMSDDALCGAAVMLSTQSGRLYGLLDAMPGPVDMDELMTDMQVAYANACRDAFEKMRASTAAGESACIRKEDLH